MMELLTTLVPAFLPVAADGARALINKITNGSGAKPANVGELIELRKADIEQLKVLADIDQPSGKARQWVYDLRESCRYIVVYIIMGNWTYQLIGNGQSIEAASYLAQSAFFFLFGDRVYLNLKNRAEGKT